VEVMHAHYVIRVEVWGFDAYKKAVAAANRALMELVKTVSARTGRVPIKLPSPIEGHEREVHEYGWIELSVEERYWGARATAKGTAYVNLASYSLASWLPAAARIALRLGRSVVVAARPLLRQLSDYLSRVLAKALGALLVLVTIKEVLGRTVEVVVEEVVEAARESPAVAALLLLAAAAFLLGGDER